MLPIYRQREVGFITKQAYDTTYSGKVDEFHYYTAGKLKRYRIRMAPGDHVSEGRYTFVFQGVDESTGPNYTTRRGEFQVLRNGQEVTRLRPEKRH